MKLRWKENEFNQHLRLTMLAALVGLTAGFASIVLKYLINFFHTTLWRSSDIITAVSTQPWYLTLLIPAFGGLLIAPLIYFIAREAKGHGVPEILEALIFRGGRIHPKVALVKALASSISIGSGGSVGREGPIVQISSSLASTLGQLFRIKDKGMRTLVAAGAAAGIGATFNAPIAGTLFAVEVLLGEFGVSSFSPIIVSSVIATLTARMITGDFSAFTVPQYTLSSIWEIGPYILLGIVSGLVALLFIKVLYFAEDRFDSLPIHPLVRPLAGGFLVGGLGLAFPQTLGVGYSSIDACLQNQLLIWLALVLIVAKILSTSLTLGSGGSGGIFAPSLFLGAVTGYFVGGVFHKIAPGAISSPGAFSLVGMGAVLAAATHAPITAIIIIFELTNDYKIILPLMLTCIIASMISTGFKKESIYTIKLKRRGIVFHEGREMNILKSLSVRDFISKDTRVFSNSEHVGKIIDTAIRGKYYDFQIVDCNNNYVGSSSLAQIKKIMLEKEFLDPFVIAEDLAVIGYHLQAEGSLEDAMKIFGREDVSEIPVLEGEKYLGVVKRKDVIEAYNHEILKKEAAAGLVQTMKFSHSSKTYDIGYGHKIMEIEAPEFFWDKSLKGLNLKARFRVDVLLIKRPYPPRTIPLPLADEIIKKGDQLVLAGREDRLSKIMDFRRKE